MSNIFNDILSSTEFQEEFFIAETQARLSQILEEKGVTRAELARRLDVSRARISQIFSDDAKNFTLRLLVRSYLALGEEPMIVSRSEYESHKRKPQPGPGGGRVEQTADGLAEALIASLLRANLESGNVERDKPSKRASDLKDWASAGSNVIPFGLRANG